MSGSGKCPVFIQLLNISYGDQWYTLVDKSGNIKDVPHDYIELEEPVKVRYLKLENIHVPTGKFAISGSRVFGKGNDDLPREVEQFVV